MRESDLPGARATARLPALDIEIVHRRSPDGNVEQGSISLQAEPSFEAFGRFLESINPFVFWTHLAQMAWSPWLVSSRSILLPWDFRHLFTAPPDTIPSPSEGKYPSGELR